MNRATGVVGPMSARSFTRARTCEVNALIEVLALLRLKLCSQILLAELLGCVLTRFPAGAAAKHEEEASSRARTAGRQHPAGGPVASAPSSSTAAPPAIPGMGICVCLSPELHLGVGCDVPRRQHSAGHVEPRPSLLLVPHSGRPCRAM